jgi:hypothetical protein
MLPELLQKANLFSLLYRIDQDLAESVKTKKCRFCQSRLDSSNYLRKPRGGPADIDEAHLVRFSLCCSREGCRRRTLPPSTRFDGRRVYWRCIILVVMALRQNRPEGKSIRRLQRMFSISRQTITRWIRYFSEEFPEGEQWKRLRGRLDAEVGNSRLPGDLLSRFMERFHPPETALVKCLKFMAGGAESIT